MRAFLSLISMYLVFNLGLIVFGAGIGSLIHWILPSVDLGTGILIGLVATGFSIHYFTRMMSFVEVLDDTDDEDDDDIMPRFRILPVPPPQIGTETEAEVISTTERNSGDS